MGLAIPVMILVKSDVVFTEKGPHLLTSGKGGGGGGGVWPT